MIRFIMVLIFLLFSVQASDYHQMVAGKLFRLDGVLYEYDVNNDGHIDLDEKLFLRGEGNFFETGDVYKMYGSTPSEQNVPGWAKIDMEPLQIKPDALMFALNEDLDQDGSIRYDWMMFEDITESSLLRKLTGIDAEGQMTYSEVFKAGSVVLYKSHTGETVYYDESVNYIYRGETFDGTYILYAPQSYPFDTNYSNTGFAMNEAGFYGDGVKFGNDTIVGKWYLFFYGPPLYLETPYWTIFDADGTYSWNYFTDMVMPTPPYGITEDGMGITLMNYGGQGDIFYEIVGKILGCYELHGNGFDQYAYTNILFMCKDTIPQFFSDQIQEEVLDKLPIPWWMEEE